MMTQLIEAALRALLLALTVWAGLRIFRVHNVPAQKAAWGLVLMCALAMPLVMRWQVLPPSIASRMPAIPRHAALRLQPHRDAMPAAARADRLPAAAHGVESASTAPAILKDSSRRPERVPAAAAGSGSGAGQETFPAAATPAQMPATKESIVRRMAAWTLSAGRVYAARLVWILYLAVCAVLLLRIGYGLNLAMNLWQSAEEFVPYPQDDPGYGLRMRFSRAVSSPVTIGSGVLLPYECLEWDSKKLRIVLAHERAHVRQGDFYLQLLAGLYAAVFWFSPLGWWLKNKLSDLGEVISDRAGMEEAPNCASYAQVLLEFAALTRPNQINMARIGVAMASSRNLSQRIERLLNESSFRQAFSDGRKRMFVAVLLVPVALFAATALLRVQAAGQAAPPAAPQLAAPAPEPAPLAAPVPAMPPLPAKRAIPAPPPEPAAAGLDWDGRMKIPEEEKLALATAKLDRALMSAEAANHAYAGTISRSQDEAGSEARNSSAGHGYSYSYSSDGDAWALVTDPGEHFTFSGDWNDGMRAAIDKARKLTSGKFLWFKRGNKSYFISDPAVIAQLESMYKPIEELGRKQEELGKRQEDLGRQQEELGRKQEAASIPAPDISKEMAELNEAVAKLDARKGSTVSQDALEALQEKLADLQGRLGELEGKMGEKQGEIGELQGKLGEQQGKLGEEQGRLGEMQGKLSEEADRKIKSIIDQNLHNGKAKPVE